MFVLAVLLAPLPDLAPAAPSEQVRMSAEEAYRRLAASGTLSSASVAGTFDFGRLAAGGGGPAAARGYRFEDVEFTGQARLSRLRLTEPIRISGARFRAGLTLEGCELGAFDLKGSDVDGDLTIRDCKLGGPTAFDGSRISGETRIHATSFRLRPSFRGTSFGDRTELLACSFGWPDGPATMAASFTNARFDGPALFNNSVFHHKAKFVATVFSGDASFLNVRMMAGAVFRSVHFGGDAEFRFCRVGEADFGDADDSRMTGVTLFGGLADFRGCSFETARFDYAEFRGDTIFTDVRFGAGGASFRYANLGDRFSDFGGAATASGAPLVLSRARFPALRLRWQELGTAILAAQPDAGTLAAIHRRLAETGDDEGALEASFHLARQRFRERVARPLPPPLSQPLAFIDAAGKRVIAYGEWLVWGLPAGYGTKLGRVLLLALALWFLAAIPPAAAGLALIRLPERRRKVDETDADSPAPPHEPVSADQVTETRARPEGFRRRFPIALQFVFRLLYKVGPKGIRFVAEDPESPAARRWQRYFAALWYLGPALLLLMALTLANTSPIIGKLVDAVLL